MKKIESIIVPTLDKTERLSDYLVGKFEIITTRKGIKKAINRKLVKVNGKVGYTGDHIRGGELIELYRPKQKENIRIDVNVPILYEDEYLAVIHKPAGLIVSGHQKRTLVHALPTILTKSSEKDALDLPHTVHRLDRDTSGVMLIGKTRKSVIQLGDMFAQRAINKVYHAVVIGELDKTGTITSPIKEKDSRTSYRILHTLASDKYGGLNLVEVKPKTGRRHQIRIHFSNMGNPIFGDKTYGIEGKIAKSGGLYLHATSLQFTHPSTGEPVKIEHDLPVKFRKLFRDFDV